MGTRTTYTSTIRVPIYAGWKCFECNEINFSLGYITLSRQVTTRALFKSKLEEAKLEAINTLQSEWISSALCFLIDSKYAAHNMKSDIFFEDTICTKCRTKPKWYKNVNLNIFIALIFIAIFFGIGAISTPTSIVAWLIFAFSIGSIICCSVIKKAIYKTVENLPKEYLPVIGTLNIELVDYAKDQGKIIPTPDEILEIISNYVVNNTDNSVANENTKNETEIKTEQNIFCRKCGVQLHSDSEFCHKCGIKIIK